jgi:hypothetical protein
MIWRGVLGGRGFVVLRRRKRPIAGNDGARCPSWVYGTASATATGRIERMFRTPGMPGKVADRGKEMGRSGGV